MVDRDMSSRLNVVEVARTLKVELVLGMLIIADLRDTRSKCRPFEPIMLHSFYLLIDLSRV
jgi:hypothetical protein